MQGGPTPTVQPVIPIHCSLFFQSQLSSTFNLFQMQYPTDYVKEGQSHTIMNKNENSTIHSTNVMRYDSKVAGSEGRRRVANVPESLRAKPFEAGPVLLGDKDILKRNHQLQVMSRSRRHMKNFMPTSSAHQMGQTKPFA